MSGTRTAVGLGHYAVVRDTGWIGATGLGSCVAVILYDPIARVGGLAHVMLPTLSLSRLRDQPGRAADTAVPWLIQQMRAEGAVPDRLVGVLVGGATMFADLQPGGSVHIGERNVQHCRLALREAGVPVAAALVGAYFASSVWALRAVFLVMGILFGIHLPSSVATITATVRKEDWGKALSIQQLGPPLSLVASPLLAVLLLRWFSWNATLLWIAGLCAILGLTFLDIEYR